MWGLPPFGRRTREGRVTQGAKGTAAEGGGILSFDVHGITAGSQPTTKTYFMPLSLSSRQGVKTNPWMF